MQIRYSFKSLLTVNLAEVTYIYREMETVVF